MKKIGIKTKKRGIIGFVAAAICCVLATLAAGMLTLCYYFAPKKTNAETLTVPELVGLKADSIKAPRGFDIEKIYEYSDEIGAGVVVSQKPMAQSRRKVQDGQNVTLTLTVSLGKKTNRVPDVRGMSDISAAIKLREIGAEVMEVSVFDSAKPSGEVISSDPPAGSLIEQGERVVLYVAKKRVAASVRVPDLLGEEIDDACRRIMSIGLKIGSIEYRDGVSEGDGCIISQSISANMYVKHGTYIDLVVGKNEMENEPETETKKTKPKAPWWSFWGSLY